MELLSNASDIKPNVLANQIQVASYKHNELN